MIYTLYSYYVMFYVKCLSWKADLREVVHFSGASRKLVRWLSSAVYLAPKIHFHTKCRILSLLHLLRVLVPIPPSNPTLSKTSTKRISALIQLGLHLLQTMWSGPNWGCFLVEMDTTVLYRYEGCFPDLTLAHRHEFLSSPLFGLA